uniref:Uncharacterized protein n=1 Tax=Arundo donax TaxID=35708 RepID=A0A0A9I3S1_ARUDO
MLLTVILILMLLKVNFDTSR